MLGYRNIRELGWYLWISLTKFLAVWLKTKPVSTFSMLFKTTAMVFLFTSAQSVYAKKHFTCMLLAEVDFLDPNSGWSGKQGNAIKMLRQKWPVLTQYSNSYIQGYSRSQSITNEMYAESFYTKFYVLRSDPKRLRLYRFDNCFQQSFLENKITRTQLYKKICCRQLTACENWSRWEIIAEHLSLITRQHN